MGDMVEIVYQAEREHYDLKDTFARRSPAKRPWAVAVAAIAFVAVAFATAMVCMAALPGMRVWPAPLYMVIALAVLSVGGMALGFGLLRRPAGDASPEGQKEEQPGETAEELILELQQREQHLHRLLQEKEDEATALYLYNLVHGTQAADERAMRFPHANFFVLLLRLDEGAHILADVMKEQRNYFSKRMIAVAIQALSPIGQGYGVELVSSSVTVAILVSMPHEDMRDIIDRVYEATREVQRQVLAETGYTLSAGIGQCYSDTNDISDSYFESIEAVKRRVVSGKGSITAWHISLYQNVGYTYPQHLETKLLNSISVRNREAANEAIDDLEACLRDVHADSIYQNYNQLANAIMRYLLQKNRSIEMSGDSVQHLINRISDTETLRELTGLIKEFVKQVIDELEMENMEADPYLPKILAYIAENHSKDIIFEDMAMEIGISYSYMRRIMRDRTKTSLLDTVHQYRIERAKEMMRDPDKTLRVISEAVGYKTMKSFERFFRKYEGVLPSEYRAAQEAAE